MLLVFALSPSSRSTPATRRPIAHPRSEWFNPFDICTQSTFFRGLLLILHLLGLGHRRRRQRGDRGSDPHARPGRCLLHRPAAGHLHAGDLRRQAFAGIGDEGIGLGNQDNSGDVISVLGKAVFGATGSARSSPISSSSWC